MPALTIDFQYYSLTVRVPHTVKSLDSFLDWAHSPEFPETGSISFIDGEVLIDMSPERIESHGQLKADLVGQLYALIRKHSLGRLFTDSTMIVNRKAKVANEPDLVFCSWDALDTGRVRLVTRSKTSTDPHYLEGSPTLVAELISRSSTRKDRVLLRKQYFLAGIEEYWLIDARKADEVKFELLVRGPKKFVSAKLAKDGSQRSEVLQHWVDVSRRNDGHGGSEYKFDFRSVIS